MNYKDKVERISYDMILLPNSNPIVCYGIGFRDCKLAAMEIASKADAEIENLKTILRKQIMIYQVDDQAWDKEESANRVMNRLLDISAPFVKCEDEDVNYDK